MKNKFVLSFVMTLVASLLIACTSNTTKITNEVASFIEENKLNYDAEGNSYSYIVERNS